MVDASSLLDQEQQFSIEKLQEHIAHWTNKNSDIENQEDISILKKCISNILNTQNLEKEVMLSDSLDNLIRQLKLCHVEMQKDSNNSLLIWLTEHFHSIQGSTFYKNH